MSWFWRFTKIWTTSWMKVHSSTSTENLWQNMLIGITTEISDSDHQLFSSTFLTVLDKYLSFWQTYYQQNLHWTKIFLSSVIFNVWHKSQIAGCTLFFPLPAKQCTGRSVQTSLKSLQKWWLLLTRLPPCISKAQWDTHPRCWEAVGRFWGCQVSVVHHLLIWLSQVAVELWGKVTLWERGQRRSWCLDGSSSVQRVRWCHPALCRCLHQA